MSKFFLKLIRIYQVLISPFLLNRCRFYPSCSNYFYQSVEKYGLARGIFIGTKRLLRCHPYNPGGIDFP